MYNYFFIIGKCISYDNGTSCLKVSCQRDFKDVDRKYKVDDNYMLVAERIMLQGTYE